MDAERCRSFGRPLREWRAGHRHRWIDAWRRSRGRPPHGGDTPDRALHAFAGWQATHDVVHVGRPEDLSEAAHLSDRRRAAATGQLAIRRLVRLRRSGATHIDHSPEAASIGGMAMKHMRYLVMTG